jgi:hypothetical protein
MKIIIEREITRDTYPNPEEITAEFDFEKNTIEVDGWKYTLPKGLKIVLGE